jgi:hypothetical protein
VLGSVSVSDTWRCLNVKATLRTKRHRLRAGSYQDSIRRRNDLTFSLKEGPTTPSICIKAERHGARLLGSGDVVSIWSIRSQ